jgi:hypothetical protein
VVILSPPPPPLFERARSGLLVPRPVPVLPFVLGYLGAAAGAARGVTPAPSGGSPPTYISTQDGGTVTESRSVSITIPSGTTDCYVCTGNENVDSRVITSLSIGGVSGTQIAFKVSNAYGADLNYAGIWRVTNVGTGSQTLAITATLATQPMAYKVVYISGGGTPVITADNTAAGSSISTNITTTVDNSLILDCLVNGAAQTGDPSGSATENGADINAAGSRTVSSRFVKVTAGTEAMAWSMSGSMVRAAHVVIAIPPA